MKVRILILAAVLAANASAHEVDPVFAQFAHDDSPGCVVGIEHGSDPKVIRTFGSADLEHRIPITADTVFEAGSVSKQFTAAATLLLVQQGKLALHDDIRKYLPELPDYGTPITLDQLLNHTSGLRDWGDVEAIAGWPRGTRIYTLSDVLEIASRQRSLNYRPGSEWLYTNTGFTLLAIIVERVSKLSLAEFTRQNFFVPLNMSHTQWRDDFRRIVANRAIAYGHGTNGYEQNMPFENAYGNGGLLTTIGDLLIWNRALGNGQVKVAAELQQTAALSNGTPVEYGRGLFIQTYRQVHELAHSGSTAGYRAWLGRYPDHQLSIALLCNAGYADNRGLAHKVANLYLPAAKESDHEPPQLPMGLFVDEDHGQVIRVDGHPLKSGDSIATLVDNDHLSVHNSDGMVSHYRREQPWHPDTAALAKFVGSYQSMEALVTYTVRQETDRLIATPVGRTEAAVTLRPLATNTFVFGDDGQGLVHFSSKEMEITTMHVRRLQLSAK